MSAEHFRTDDTEYFDEYATHGPSQIVPDVSRLVALRSIEVVELPDEIVPPAQATPTETVGGDNPKGSLNNPHIVDPSDIPGTAPRGGGANAKGYYRFEKQSGEAAQ